VSGALDGLTVVVTRPAAQAGRFIELVRAAGAVCIASPALQIEALALSETTLARLRQRRWDWAVFTSTNAVVALFERIPPPLATRHAAVGRATARALEQAGVTVDARPGSATSEGLLGLPGFADLAGRGVLIVKGAGGRELLRQSLQERGAEVLELETYRRVPVPPPAAAAAELRTALEAGRRMVVTATSVEILQSLLDHVPSADEAGLRWQTLVVPGARVAAAATHLGWRGPVVQAATAEDDAMLEALFPLARGAPPAA
jgi:uroporphyrinogen-III synthase